jgi:hypothetical protein
MRKMKALTDMMATTGAPLTEIEGVQFRRRIAHCR